MACWLTVTVSGTTVAPDPGTEQLRNNQTIVLLVKVQELPTYFSLLQIQPMVQSPSRHLESVWRRKFFVGLWNSSMEILVILVRIRTFKCPIRHAWTIPKRTMIQTSSFSATIQEPSISYDAEFPIILSERIVTDFRPVIPDFRPVIPDFRPLIPQNFGITPWAFSNLMVQLEKRRMVTGGWIQNFCTKNMRNLQNDHFKWTTDCKRGCWTSKLT